MSGPLCPVPPCRLRPYPPRLALRYDRVMSDFIPTPILAAALARKPRRGVVHKGGGGRKNASHNFVAEGEKRRPGAPLGNRNAACRDSWMLERRERLALARAVADETLALARAILAAAGRDPKARQRLPARLPPEAQS